jgi:hypothetical protein
MYREDLETTGSAVEGVSLQRSLAAFITKVYWWMTFALALTGLAAWAVGTSPELIKIFVKSPGLMIGLVIVELALVFGISFLINKISAATATALFIAYSVVSGITLAPIFIVYTMSSIGMAFGLTAGVFGVMAIYGTLTKRDLTSIGSICFMALIGIIVAALVNVFVGSSMMQTIISALCILVFTGLTAYDAQKIKSMYLDASGSGELVRKAAVLGALALYLDFINIFISILQLLGNRRD